MEQRTYNNTTPRKNLNSYIQLQTTRKLPLFHIVREEEDFYAPNSHAFQLVNNQPQLTLFTTPTGLTELSCLEGIMILSQSRMPQLDKFTYFSQFFWSCFFLFTFYILICNDGDGVLGISRILKLRNQLVSHRGKTIRSNDPNCLKDILRKGFSTGVSYMYSSLFEVSQWCKAVDLFGKRRKITLISCFGEISGSRGMERNCLYLISKSAYSTSPAWGRSCRNYIMLIHVLYGQGKIESHYEL